MYSQLQNISNRKRKRREEGHRMTWRNYHSEDDMNSFFDYLEEKYKGRGTDQQYLDTIFDFLFNSFARPCSIITFAN